MAYNILIKANVSYESTDPYIIEVTLQSTETPANIYPLSLVSYILSQSTPEIIPKILNGKS
jgi:hypothetical protein